MGDGLSEKVRLSLVFKPGTSDQGLRYYFEKKFEHVIENSIKQALDEEQSGFARTFTNLFKRKINVPSPSEDDAEEHSEKEKKKKLRTDMIRRMDDAPKLVNPSGWISEGDRIPVKRHNTVQSNANMDGRHLSFTEKSPERNSSQVVVVPPRRVLPSSRKGRSSKSSL